MSNLTVQFEGLREFENLIGLLPKKMNKSAEAVIKNSAEKAKYKSMKYSPIDTWFMHDNIFTHHSFMSSEVQSTATYSGYVNYGTRFQAPQPFFSKAIEEMEPLFRKDMGKVIKGVLSV